MLGMPNDDQFWVYLLRLAAFVVLIVGIVSKNLGRSQAQNRYKANGSKGRGRDGFCRLRIDVMARAQIRRSDVDLSPALPRLSLVQKFLQPGRNVWRRELADRAALLCDAGQYFGALRKAFVKARRSIFIIGWDIDSRTRLVGEDCTPTMAIPRV